VTLCSKVIGLLIIILTRILGDIISSSDEESFLYIFNLVMILFHLNEKSLKYFRLKSYTFHYSKSRKKKINDIRLKRSMQ
jgi:hypothetical protein